MKVPEKLENYGKNASEIGVFDGYLDILRSEGDVFKGRKACIFDVWVQCSSLGPDAGELSRRNSRIGIYPQEIQKGNWEDIKNVGRSGIECLPGQNRKARDCLCVSCMERTESSSKLHKVEIEPSKYDFAALQERCYEDHEIAASSSGKDKSKMVQARANRVNMGSCGAIRTTIRDTHTSRLRFAFAQDRDVSPKGFGHRILRKHSRKLAYFGKGQIRRKTCRPTVSSRYRVLSQKVLRMARRADDEGRAQRRKNRGRSKRRSFDMVCEGKRNRKGELHNYGQSHNRYREKDERDVSRKGISLLLPRPEEKRCSSVLLDSRVGHYRSSRSFKAREVRANNSIFGIKIRDSSKSILDPRKEKGRDPLNLPAHYDTKSLAQREFLRVCEWGHWDSNPGPRVSPVGQRSSYSSSFS
ncbi:hypothetical protein ABOONEI_1357 [Aciduliprofundum boonei T469]|nr:hypothetical protein ABOONEI_1357 [Aciduliprofundum boonei T469]